VIRGHPRQPSVRPGERLTLRVATDQPSVRVESYRQGVALVPMERLGPDRRLGIDVPPGPPDRDWGRPGYRLELPADRPSGACVLMLVQIDLPDTTTPDGTSAKPLVVVRDQVPGRDTSILMKLCWATHHAYNATGSGSLYAEAVWSSKEGRPGFTVTTRRPGRQTGGEVMYGDSPDAYDPTTHCALVRGLPGRPDRGHGPRAQRDVGRRPTGKAELARCCASATT